MNDRTAVSSTSPPSTVTRPSTAPYGTGQAGFRHRHHERLTTPPLHRTAHCCGAPPVPYRPCIGRFSPARGPPLIRHIMQYLSVRRPERTKKRKKGAGQQEVGVCGTFFVLSFACRDEKRPLVERDGRFAKKDQVRLPAHWPLFLARTSPLTKSSRASSNPINTLLNYLYAILETEVRLAILAMGMDPGMGILHADLKGRDSFVFDVIEPLRPVVDEQVLTLLERRTFSAREFFETREGVCA